MDRFCSELPTYISQGWVLILKDMDPVYSILQDILNMRYVSFGGKEHCKLIYNDSEKKVVIHPEFRLVVLQSQTLAATSDAGQSYSHGDMSAPFQNRMEKYMVTFELILNQSLESIKNFF